MTLRDAAGLVGLLGCAALLTWSDLLAQAPADCRMSASAPAPQEEVVTDFLFAPASVWKNFALERDLDVAMLRSHGASSAGAPRR